MFSYKSTIEQSFITGSNELMVPGRVTTCCIIPQGAISETIEPGSLIGQVDVAQVVNSKTLIVYKIIADY